jgi:predicted O-methyltransferase YrrM
MVGYSVINDSASGVNVAASDTQWAQSWIILDGLELATLSAKSGDVVGPTAARVHRKLAAATEWLPSIIHTPVDIIQSACNVAGESMQADRVCELQWAALIWIQRILRDCPLTDVAPSPPHLRRLHDGMTRLYNAAIQGDNFPEHTRLKMLLSSPRQVQDEALQQVASSSIDGEILDHHCRMLDRILRGSMHSIGALLEESRLHRWYAEGITWRANHDKVSSYLRLHARNNPQAQILEIGGGTGGLTLSALRAMTLSDGSALFDSYCFTDISGGFFEKARNKFAAWAHCMSFATLNIEHDLEGQGFGAAQFDLILADNVLHATKSIRHTLSAVRKLLKPYGSLCIFCATRILTAAVVELVD